MKAIIRLDVPDWQIGQEVAVYFPDTMWKHGICEKDGIILCKDCKHYLLPDGESRGQCMARAGWFPVDEDWYCADGERN